ncbi:MAG: PIN domain-containing protein [Planctomycetaceae bacterium]|nr:PIN domain-containing protein [Planctomycetaceae bacterium]
MGLLIFRCIFIFIASSVAVLAIWSADALNKTTVLNEAGELVSGPGDTLGYGVFFAIFFISIAVLALDIAIPRKRVEWLSAICFGSMLGLALTTILCSTIVPMICILLVFTPKGTELFQTLIVPITAVNLCYLCISFLLQTGGNFRFIIPFVEFQKTAKGNKSLVLDTSVIIDGRIADVVETALIDNRLIVPTFVVAELQRVADSADRGRRTRGRRGLDILNRLQNMGNIDIQLDDTELADMKGQPVDLKLVALTKHMEGKLVTNDYNLNKVARVQGVQVINLNDLANAMKPVFLPGEHLEVDIVKVGEEAGQGIGYLDDGTMVVIEGGRNHISERANVTVTSVLQNSAGRMIFGRYEYMTKRLGGTTVSLDGTPKAHATSRN